MSQPETKKLATKSNIFGNNYLAIINVKRIKSPRQFFEFFPLTPRIARFFFVRAYEFLNGILFVFVGCQLGITDSCADATPSSEYVPPAES